jgi:hypothetical protein
VETDASQQFEEFIERQPALFEHVRKRSFSQDWVHRYNGPKYYFSGTFFHGNVASFLP